MFTSERGLAERTWSLWEWFSARPVAVAVRSPSVNTVCSGDVPSSACTHRIQLFPSLFVFMKMTAAEGNGLQTKHSHTLTRSHRASVNVSHTGCLHLLSVVRTSLISAAHSFRVFCSVHLHPGVVVPSSPTHSGPRVEVVFRSAGPTPEGTGSRSQTAMVERTDRIDDPSCLHHVPLNERMKSHPDYVSFVHIISTAPILRMTASLSKSFRPLWPIPAPTECV